MTTCPSLKPNAPELFTSGLAAHDAGFCVLPPRQDGSKQPDRTSWVRYQRQRPNREEVERWYRDGRRTGIGYVCGAISSNLELFEFDDVDTYEHFLAAARAADLGSLVDCVRQGYCEQTPGSGIHWYYRLANTPAKTTALARRPAVDSNGRPRPEALIETKGEGGYAVAAPSHGTVHPSGQPYRLLAGGPATIATLTADERDALWSLARTFDEVPRMELPEGGRSTRDGGWQVRPGDAFNEQARWAEILEPHGWEAMREHGAETLWRRPGGYPGGWGASTNHAGTDRLYVWTTATAFAPDHSYSKFTAYTVLNHDGDFAAAARVLAAEGYGERADPAPSMGSTVPSGPHVSVPAFPVDALPPVARAYVVAGAEALGCPPDFIAPHIFTFCGAVAGNSRKLQLKPGFDVAPIFWTGVIGRPGTVKTPALNHGRRTLDTLQREAWERYQLALEAWQETPAAERGPKPRPEHFFATDTTTEAVASALTGSRGLVVIHDELAGWVGSFDAYRQAGDRQTWLSAWSGSPLKPNRKTGDPIYIPDPVVGITGGIQPDVLPDLAGEAARDDGFLPRLLLAWPDAEPAPWTDRSVSQQTVDAMLEVVRGLRLPGEQTVVTVLTPGAYAVWVGWYEENRQLIAASTGLAAGWAAKAPVHLARIALVLHLLAHPADHTGKLDAATLGDAIAVVEYYRAHLGRVLPVFGAVAPTAGAGLTARVGRVLARAFPVWVGRAELAVRLGGHDQSHAVGAALDHLEAQGRVERRIEATGGRPREAWRWRPPTAAPDPVRDKGNDMTSTSGEDLSRNHVFTQHPPPGPDANWEQWEESL